MGTLWSAFDQVDEREVVIKTLSADLVDNDEAQRRFELEVDVIASLASPHIVTLHGSGVVDGCPFMVLERLRGEDLEQRLLRGPLDLESCATVVEQVASALLVAHSSGVIHRDVKPGNIFLADDGGRQVVKLLDFGVAKLRDRQRIRTGAGLTVGSPEFMSPEQIQGLSTIDGRSDVFSLAAVAYAALTGHLPFAGHTVVDTFQRILRGAFDPPGRHRPELAGAFDSFFRRAFAIDPARRFSNAAALAAAFRDVVDVLRFAGRKPPPEGTPRWLGSTAVEAPGRPPRRVERRRLAVAAAAVASLIGVWAACWTWIGEARARDAATEASDHDTPSAPREADDAAGKSVSGSSPSSSR